MALALLFFGGCGSRESPASEPKYAGLAYATWFPPQSWAQTWSKPLLGEYKSDDPAIIAAHAEMIADAGFDFIMTDASNGILYVNGTNDNNHYWIEDVATQALFETYRMLTKKPRIAVMLGVAGTDPEAGASAFHNGHFVRKLNWLWDTYYSKPEYQDILFFYEGKPLVTVYLDTPASSFSPPFSDDRVTLRFLTGFIGQQPQALADPTGQSRVSKFLWSWWERGNNTYTLRADGKPECMTLSAAWKGDTGWFESCQNDGTFIPAKGTTGRRDGDTFREQWARAIEVNPQIVLVQSFNEWVSFMITEPYYNDGEERDPEYSNDIEPSEAWGTMYMDIAREQIANFKAKPY